MKSLILSLRGNQKVVSCMLRAGHPTLTPLCEGRGRWDLSNALTSRQVFSHSLTMPNFDLWGKHLTYIHIYLARHIYCTCVHTRGLRSVTEAQPYPNPSYREQLANRTVNFTLPHVLTLRNSNTFISPLKQKLVK